MKVNRNLEITAEEFFDVLFQQVIDDVHKKTSKELKKSDFKKGFKFIDRGDEKTPRSSFEVIDYQPYTYYKAKRSSINGTTTVTYRVKPVDKGINVEFEQISTELTSGKGLFGTFSETVYLGRMTDHLYNIQKKILFEKEGMEEVNPFRPKMPKFLQKKK